MYWEYKYMLKGLLQKKEKSCAIQSILSFLTQDVQK